MSGGGAKIPALFGEPVAALHCVGVGGMGLGPLAIYLAGRGFSVSGEDDSMTPAMRAQLDASGVAITAAGAVPASARMLVCSSAIPASHPAMRVAGERGLRVVRRGELLAEATRDKKLVAVCGSHGKTSTTAMLVTALRAAGFPAGHVLGGLFNGAEKSTPPARAGENDWVVAEIDESDGTIRNFSPEITVAVNLDWDHPDHYREQADLEAAFGALFARTRGVVLVNEACALSARARAGAADATRWFTFGPTGDFSGKVDASASGDGSQGIDLVLGGRFAGGRASVRALGNFNAANATAALAAAQLMGATASVSPGNLLAAYPGVRRRQAVLHADRELTVIEDYAHHPAEIRALLGSLRARTAGGRLAVVFQPHRFSRTAQFKSGFADALALADAVYLVDVYGAGEAPVAGGATADVAAELRGKAPTLPVVYRADDEGALLEALTLDKKPGDLVAFVGAGDIDALARDWLKKVDALRWDRAAEVLKKTVREGTRLAREESLAAKTTIRIGGAARLYAEPADEEDLRALVKAAKSLGLPLIVLGRGSNLLVPDEGVDALVVSLRQPWWEAFEPRADGRVWAGAGLRLKNLCGLAAKAGLQGFEFLEGIPGNLGGALRMNAGAMNGMTFDVVDEVRLMTFDGEIRTLAKAAMHVDYRHCAELHDAIALGAVLRPASRAESDDVARRIEVYKEKRQKSQPREPSAGCIFKNPAGDSAGRLIDASGLKGERVGDAEVSATHANFIVNRGHASAADVIALVRRVRARVARAQGIDLEPEVLLYGKNWKDVL